MPTICTVSGIVLQPSGIGFTGVTVIATMDRPFMYPSTGQVIPNYQMVTQTLSDGTWSMDLIETATSGVTVTFAFQYSQAAGSANQRYEYTATIPNAASASFSDIINTTSDGEGFVVPAIPGYDTVADLPVTAENGFLARVLESPASLYEFDLATTTWNLVGPGGSGGSGILSINADTSTAQLIVTGSSGTDFVISTVAGTTTIDIPTASASNRGLLSSADWATFNGKQNPITPANLTAAGSDGISVTGGSGAVLSTASISQTQSSASTNGFLSSTDWSTFNNKGSGNGTVTAVSVASANGLAGSSSGGATPALTLSTTVTGILQGNGTAISAATATGSGSVVLATSPTLVTPALGTPSSATLTNATGLPIVAGTTGTLSVARGGTGVTSSTGSGNTVLSISPVLVTPNLGTPSAAVLTSATGLPLTSGVTGTLPIANGGTGGITAAAARANLLLPRTIQRFLTGSGTYNLPSPPPLYLTVELAAGGAGGTGSGTGGAGTGTTGSATTFGTSLLTANPGIGAVFGSVNGGVGGTVTVNAPALPIVALQGGMGAAPFGTATVASPGGQGGTNRFGTSSGGASFGPGSAGIPNTGSGGGGAGGNNSGVSGQSGGGAGGYILAQIDSPSSTYPYSVGGGGSGGTAGTSGYAGGNGAVGVIIVTEHYQ